MELSLQYMAVRYKELKEKESAMKSEIETLKENIKKVLAEQSLNIVNVQGFDGEILEVKVADSSREGFDAKSLKVEYPEIHNRFITKIDVCTLTVKKAKNQNA